MELEEFRLLKATQRANWNE